MTYATSEAIIGISFVFPILGFIVVGLRFWVRRTQRSDYGLDDWLLIPAVIFQAVLAALLLWGAFEESLGRSIPPPTDPSPTAYLTFTSPQQIRFLTIQYVFDIFIVLAFGAIKLSILCFYRRLFCGPNVIKSRFHYINDFMIGVIIVWTVAFTFAMIFLCGKTPEAAWDVLAVVAVKCSAQLPTLQGFAISDFLTDLLILVLPLPKIWHLHMPVSRKLGVSAVFLVGVLALAASTTRMAIYQIFIIDAFSFPDGEVLVSTLLFWSMIECGLGILVACLPALRPLTGNWTPDGLMDSIRSMFGLDSIRVRSRESGDPNSLRVESFDGSLQYLSPFKRSAWISGLSPSEKAFDVERSAAVPNGQIVVATDIRHEISKKWSR